MSTFTVNLGETGSAGTMFLGARPADDARAVCWKNLSHLIEQDLDFGRGISGINQRDVNGNLVGTTFYLSDKTIRAILKADEEFPGWNLARTAAEHAEPATRRRFADF